MVRAGGEAAAGGEPGRQDQGGGERIASAIEHELLQSLLLFMALGQPPCGD